MAEGQSERIIITNVFQSLADRADIPQEPVERVVACVTEFIDAQNDCIQRVEHRLRQVCPGVYLEEAPAGNGEDSPMLSVAPKECLVRHGSIGGESGADVRYLARRNSEPKRKSEKDTMAALYYALADLADIANIPRKPFQRVIKSVSAVRDARNARIQSLHDQITQMQSNGVSVTSVMDIEGDAAESAEAGPSGIPPAADEATAVVKLRAMLMHFGAKTGIPKESMSIILSWLNGLMVSQIVHVARLENKLGGMRQDPKSRMYIQG